MYVLFIYTYIGGIKSLTIAVLFMVSYIFINLAWVDFCVVNVLTRLCIIVVGVIVIKMK